MSALLLVSLMFIQGEFDFISHDEVVEFCANEVLEDASTEVRNSCNVVLDEAL